MRRDTDAIELPPPAPGYGGMAGGDHVKGTPDEPGTQPIDGVQKAPGLDEPAMIADGEADPSATQTEGMPIDHAGRPADRDPSA
jgi:hypothetical protein